MRALFTVSASLMICSQSLGQELLVNPSFDEPALAGCTPFDQGGADAWQNQTRRNGSVWIPPCPRDGDFTYATMSIGGNNGSDRFWQTVTDVDNSKTYTFSGLWNIGRTVTGGPPSSYMRAKAELRDGSDPDNSPLLAEQKIELLGASSGQTPGWLPFSINGKPAGTTLTVVLRMEFNYYYGYAWPAAHFDACSPRPAECLSPPTLDTISPTYAARGTVVDNATITGGNFVPGLTTVKLVRPGEEIVASDVVVQAGGASLTCDFDLTTASLGRWTVQVSVADNPPSFNCAPAFLADGFNVVLPALSNGSFELPTAAGGCPAVPIPGMPTDWQYIDRVGYAGAPYRDSDQSPPTCPPPDGLHYASSSSNAGGAAGSTAYQTVLAEPGKVYTFSGYLAGSGNNSVRLLLLDGDELADPIASFVVREGGQSDWSYAFVSGAPTGNLLTVAWDITNLGAGPHHNHADGFLLLSCAIPGFSATGVNPLSILNTGVQTITVTGSGFSGGSTPQVVLTKPGSVAVAATNVQVVNDSQLSCDVDLGGAATGFWDVVVSHDGCVARTSEVNVRLLAVGTFVNGEFELPDVGPVQCGPPPVTIQAVPFGWNVDLQSGAMVRDSAVYVVPCPCPQSAGGHYGSLSSDTAGLLFAYQTVRVTPGRTYRFSGWFAGGGLNAVRLALIDGADHLLLPLAETTVHQHSGSEDPFEQYDWTAGSVEATAVSDVMTVVWYMDIIDDRGGAVPSTSHADGLKFEDLAPPCSTPPQDVEGDGDVDLTDFGMFQACFNGPNRPWPPPPLDQQKCRCLDADSDGDVDLADFGAFQSCFNGPNRAPVCLPM